jgi:hypothetical protein
MDPTGRYRLTLDFDGATIATGWWEKRVNAERKFTSWVGDHGRDGARITLVDTGTGDVVKSWPY